MKENLKVAFVGDTDVNPNSFRVLQMCKDENVDVVLHQGDLSYKFGKGDTDEKVIDDFFDMVDSIFGANFPYFVTVGNHDVNYWDVYAERFLARETEIKFMNEGECQQFMNCCEGDYGINMICNLFGLRVLFSGLGLLGDSWEQYAHEKLGSAQQTWKVCATHLVSKELQVSAGYHGGNMDGLFFDECALHGAFIAGAHAHSYSRSHLMSNFSVPKLADTPTAKSNTIEISEGQTMIMISSTGGGDIRDLDSNLAAQPHWAKVGANAPGDPDLDLTHGGVICTFNVDGVLEQAECYYKDMDGNEFDRFNLVRKVTDVQEHEKPGESAVHTSAVPDQEDFEDEPPEIEAADENDQGEDQGEACPSILPGRVSGSRVAELTDLDDTEGCCSACMSRNQCKFWTFSTAQNICILRSTKGEVQSYPGWYYGEIVRGPPVKGSVLLVSAGDTMIFSVVGVAVIMMANVYRRRRRYRQVETVQN